MQNNEAVNAVLREIERRELLWKELLGIAKSVLESVQDYAKQSGITDTAWLYTSAGTLRYSFITVRWQRSKSKFEIVIYASGEVKNSMKQQDRHYKGLPPLQDSDLPIFERRAAEELLAQLHNFISDSE